VSWEVQNLQDAINSRQVNTDLSACPS